MWRVMVLLALVAPASAESLVATRTIRAKTVLSPDHLTLVNAELAGALTSPDQAVGLAPPLAIYPGKPVAPGARGPPAPRR